MTTPRVQSDEPNAMGPISYLIVEFPGSEFPGSEFPGSKMTGEGFPMLVDLVDRGLIRILDLRFVRRAMDGSMRAIELRDIDRDGQFDVAIFEGASSGLLDDSDIADARSVIRARPGCRYLPLLAAALPLTIGLGTLLALALDGSAGVWLAPLVGAALAPTAGRAT